MFNMRFSMCGLFDKPPSPSPTDNVIRGPAYSIANHIYSDIQVVKMEINSYNSQTKIFNSSPLYYKMFKMLESSQARQIRTLKQSHGFNFTREYYKELIELYKQSLSELEQFLHLIKNSHNNTLLEKSKSDSRKSSISEHTDEVPEDLLDPLSYEIFSDPVVTPSGITYEKALILQHLDKNGKFDPITREALNHHQLYPNLAMKNTVNAYIANRV